MSPRPVGKLAFLIVCCASAAASPIGCDPFTTCTVFPKTEPFKDALYPLSIKDGPKKEKEAVVALFVSIAPGMGPECARSEVKLASDLSKMFPEMAKENKQKLSVIDPVQINKFAMKTPNFTRMHPCEWGWNLGADFVFTIHLDKMSLYQPGSRNQILDASADVIVDVFDVAAGPAGPKYHYMDQFKYPNSGVIDKGTMISVTRFKQEFMEHLAVDICRKHFKHKASEEAAYAK
jgi:hypothetical protein